ncbi:hypothetical protein A7E78_00890 [Syntrophotalea acetylenivorans]|uniref:DUF1858 domain-containing protein n=1 Tax=Syntrophotalea acetylenivorans TaxID=1842532 RepID=A0A1L3GKR6_9BACT|nr:ABC transporter substrate-binding protein [Syntrophotalea acetylenivorans]APG26543.1 hypothetical protein A7E78_00890 [Syntrophotalea acetylenivorans]
MIQSIHLDMKIADLVNRWPETRPVFAAHGLEALTSEEGMRVLAPFLTLGTALRSRGVAVQSFIRLLNEAIAEEEVCEAPGLIDYQSQGDLTLLALMPCGIKVPFAKAISTFLTDLRKAGGPAITYAVEGNLNQELSYYSYVSTIERIEELPDIVVSADFNSFYHQSFYKRFVEAGNFIDVAETLPTTSYEKAGILDPEHQYSILGVNPLVMVADLDKTGDRPLPACWDDLLAEHWEGEVTLRGNKDFFCHAVLLPIYREHGAEGLLKLARNVCDGLHPAQMVKAIDSAQGGALYVMPEFFAHRVKHQERIRIIWPADGALASPVTLMVKKDRVAELQPVLDYLTGKELGKVLVGARFPTPHADLPGELQEKPLKWIGWEFIRANDLAVVNAAIDDVFMPAVKGVVS